MNFNRKRRFDYSNGVPEGPGGPGGGGRGRPNFNKRFHNNRNQYQTKFAQLSPIEKTTINVCRDINKIGEDTEFGDLLKNLNHISIPIAVEFNKEDFFRNNILVTVYTTLIEQPHKILLLSCLVQVANSKNQSIGKYVVEFFHQKCLDLISSAVVGDTNSRSAAETTRMSEQNSNNTGPWNKLKLVLRFFATLTEIISKDSILKIYEQCLGVAIDLQSKYGEKRSPLAEEIYYNTLISIPFLVVFNEQDNEFKESIKQKLLQRAAEFKIANSKSIELIKPFYLTKSDVDSESDSPLPYDAQLLIRTVFPAVQQVADKGFSNVLGKLFPDFKQIISQLVTESLAGQELGVNNLPQLSFPSIDILSKVSGLDKGVGKIDSLWRTPRLLFEVFPQSNDFETMPPVISYEGLLFKDLTQDIIESLEYNKRLGSKQLLSLDFFFKPGLFVPINKSLNELIIINDFNKTVEDESQKNSTWAIEDFVVENALSLIFQLPNAQTLPMYYYNILVEACEKAPVGMAPRFGKAMRFFYNNIALLDFELRLRFMDWMSMQLSNFQFKWKWNEWIEDSQTLGRSKYHPKILFIKNLICKEIRLSTKERIQESFGDNVHEFGKYLNIAVFHSIKSLNKYDESLYGEGNNVINENTPSELVVEKTVDQPNLKFIEHPSLPFYSEATEFLALIQAKAAGTESEFWAFIEKFSTKLNDTNDEALERIPNKEKFKLNFLFQTICFATSRSISHFEAFVNKVLPRIQKLVGLPVTNFESLQAMEGQSNEDFDFEKFYKTEYSPIEDKTKLLQKEIWIIEAVLRYWSDTPQNGFIILEILERLNVLSKEAIFEYIFIDHQIEDDAESSEANVEECQVLSNSLATELFFKNLSKIAKHKDNDYVVKNFTLIVNKVIDLFNNVTSNLEKATGSAEEKIESPNAEFTEITREYDLRWKYLALKGLVKSVLRKFSDEFQFMKSSIVEKVESTVIHENTKQTLLLWLDQLGDL